MQLTHSLAARSPRSSVETAMNVVGVVDRRQGGGNNPVNHLRPPAKSAKASGVTPKNVTAAIA